jgi:hypothetical protein
MADKMKTSKEKKDGKSPKKHVNHNPQVESTKRQFDSRGEK